MWAAAGCCDRERLASVKLAHLLALLQSNTLNGCLPLRSPALCAELERQSRGRGRRRTRGGAHKPRVVWLSDMHADFEAAVAALGERRDGGWAVQTE